MKQMHGAWSFLVAVCVSILAPQSALRADTAATVTTAVPLATAVSNYISALTAATNQSDFVSVYNACLPLSDAAPSSMTDLGAQVCANWFRIDPQTLGSIRDALTSAATRLLMAYKVYAPAFANVYGVNATFTTTLLSVNDATRSVTDPNWVSFVDPNSTVFPNGAAFYTVFQELRKRRDFFKAAIDPTTLTSSATFTPSEIQNLAGDLKWLPKPSLPVGVPGAGALSALRIDVGGARHYFQLVYSPTGPVLAATGTDPLDPMVQFKMAVDFDTFGLQLTTTDATYLDASNIIGSTSWLPGKLQKATQLAFTGTSFGPGSLPSGRFKLVPVAGSGANGTSPQYLMQSLNYTATGGFVQVNVAGDLSVRVLNPNSKLNADGTFIPYGQADATPITFVAITQLYTTLTSLRSATDVVARISGYSALFDGALIATLDDFLLVVAEAQNYLDGCRSDATAWANFTSAGGSDAMRALIKKMRLNMVANPSGTTSSPATSAYTLQNNAVSALEVSLNSGMSTAAVGIRYADGSSIKNTTLVIATADGASMLVVGNNGLVSAVPRDLVNPTAQFLAEVDSAGNVNFRSASAGNNCMQVGGITTNVSGWLAQARADVSRGSCIRSLPGNPEKFTLSAQGSNLGSYAFKNLDSQGYVQIDSDNFVRSVDPSGAGATLQPNSSGPTIFMLIPVDGFIKQLSALRLEPQDQARINGYMAMAPQILTDTHVTLLLQELNTFVGNAVKSQTQWAAWQTAGLDKQLLQWMPTGLAPYSGRALYSSTQNLLTTGYVAGTTTTDQTGLSAGDVVVFQIPGQANTFLQVQQDGTFKQVTGAQYYLDPACQMTIAKNATDSSVVEFISPYLNNNALRAPDIAVPSNTTATLLVDRLAVMSCAKFDAAPDASADFDMISVATGGTSTSLGSGTPFVLKRHGKDGYLKVGADLLVRFFDAASVSANQVLPPIARTTATQIAYTVITSLQRKFVSLRVMTDDVKRVAGYNSILGNIITLGDLKLLLFELQYYIQQPRMDQQSYVSFKNVQPALIALLNQISTSFANSLAQFDSTVPTVAALTKLISTQLLQDIPTAFASLGIPDRVSYLEAMFPSVTDPDSADQFLELFGLTMTQRSMFTSDILARVQKLYASVLLNTYTKVDANTMPGSTQKELDYWNTQLTTAAQFSDVLAQLSALATTLQATKPVTSITDAQKAQFISYVAAMPALLPTAADTDRATAVSLIEAAAYTYLNDRSASILPANNAIKSFVKAQNAPATFSAQLDALNTQLQSLSASSASGGMDKFIADATALVNQRVQALTTDVTRLGGILDDALWHPLVLNQKITAGSQSYQAQITALATLVKQPIPYGDIISHLTDMLNNTPTFATTDISYFMAQANNLVSSAASQTDPTVIGAAVKVLTQGSRYQVSTQRNALDQLIAQLNKYQTTLSGTATRTYLQKLNDLKSLLTTLNASGATRALTDQEVQSFFDGLQDLVANRLDAAPSQINNLISWLSSTAVATSRVVFSKSDGITQIQQVVSTLQIEPKVTERFANLQAMLKNNPQFIDPQLKLDFIEKATDLAAPDSRQEAVAEKFDIVTGLSQLLAFAKANQFAGDTSATTGTKLLDAIVAQLSAPINQVLSSAKGASAVQAAFAALDFPSQVAALDRGTVEIVDVNTANVWLSLLNTAVAGRIAGQDSDIARLNKAIQNAQRCPGFVGNAVLLQSLQTDQATLSQPLGFADYYNAINVLVSSLPTDFTKVSSNTKTLLVNYAQKLAANLATSADQNARNTADAVIKKLAFNQLQDRSSELLAICDQIEGYVPSQQVAQKYSQAVAALMPQIDTLTASGLQAFMTSLTNLVNTRVQGTSNDYSLLKQIIDKLTWNPLVQNEPGQPTLKALTALTATLSQPLPVADLVNLLSQQLQNQTFAPDDITYFAGKAQQIVDNRTSVTDKSVLNKAITLLNQAVRYQMASKKSDLDTMIAALQAQSQTFTQQAYVAYADQIVQMQTRLSALDAKAQAQQLAAADASAFLSDLTKLVNGRAAGLPNDITTLTAWLQSAVTQSRTLFVTAGAVTTINNLITTLGQPVKYVDQYNYLAGLLQNYPNFESTQMTTDFLTRCTYLATDTAKQQAQAEGFDYAKMVTILTFAGQNQLASVKGQVDGIIAQLNAPISGAQAVTPSFNDTLTVQENGLATLSDTGTQLADYVTALEGLVSGRVAASDAELARLSALLQKVQWNAAIQQSAQAASLLQRIQACITNVAVPVTFSDEANYLVAQSKLPLTVLDQQNRFIAAVTKLLSMSSQVSDPTSLGTVIAAVKVAAYNQLQKRTELSPLVSQLDSLMAKVSQQTTLSFSQQITDLTNRSGSLTTSTVDKFLADLTTTVSGRFEAGPDGIQALATLVNSAAWLNVIRSDTTKGYAKTVAALIQEATRVPSMNERLTDLSNMLANTTLNDVQQASFVQKVVQFVSNKSRATLSQLGTAIQLVNVGMFNQVKSKAQDLQDPLNTLTQYQQTVQLTGGISFGDRIKNLQQALQGLTPQGVTDFHQQVSDLYANRVDAQDADIAAFKSLLQAATWNNVVVALKAGGSSSIADDFTNWYNTVDAPIDFVVWKQSLAQMLQAPTLPSAVQQLFMYKVNKLIAAIPRAISVQDLQDAQKLLTQASYNQLSARKADLDVAVSKLQDAASSQGSANQPSFAEGIKALQKQLASLTRASVQADVDAFVKAVSDLVDDKVDAVNNDIQSLQTWLLSNEVQNNEAIYFRQAGSAITKLANLADDPISYGLRVQNLTTLVQNNPTFTDAQKALVQAKIQILVNNRADAAKESFDLSQVVTLLQFIIDRRLDATIDASLIGTLKNAIYTFQSGSTNALRPRYGEQITALEQSLATLTAATIPQFVSNVQGMVTSRADGTADQIQALHDWLVGADVQANKVLFFSPQKATIQSLAATLITPPTYADRYNNLRQLLQDYPIFDGMNITPEFMAKALVLVQERGRAAGEKINLQVVKDLFTFAIQNRLTNDMASAATIQEYIQDLDLPADQSIATGTSVPYSKRITDLQTQFGSVTQGTFKTFISGLQQLVDSRVDATDSDITNLKTWLNSSAVQNNRIVFLSNGAAQLQPIVASLDVAITFSQRADNLRLMISNMPVFSAADQTTFFAKVDKLIAERWRATQENYNIENVVKMLQFVQANQFSSSDMRAQSDKITASIAALRSAPDQQGPVVAYVTYPNRITALQVQFGQIGSTQKDVAAMNQFVTDLNQLVADRVDGTDTDRGTLTTFIRTRVLYHPLVYGVAQFQQIFQNAINGLVAPITYGELYANFKKLLAVSVYSNDHKAVFLTKLQTLADNRGDAAKANVDLTQLVNDVTFAKLNKFGTELLDDQNRVAPDRNPTILKIENLITQLQAAPLTTLDSAITKVSNLINNLSPENWAAAGPDQKNSLLSQLRILANNVDSSTSTASQQAIDTLLVTARARVFKGDNASIALINQYRTQVGAATSSTGTTSPGYTGLASPTAGTGS